MKRASFLGAAGSLLLTATARAQTLDKIRVDGPPNDGFKAVYYGIESNLFQRYGLKVEANLVSSGAAASAAVIGGAAEFTYTNVITLLQAHLHGVPLVFVVPGAFITTANSPTFTLVLKDSPIRAARDMNGKTLGSAALRDVNSIATLAWIDKNGGDSKTVRQIEVPASSGGAMLEERRADAVTMNEPSVTRAMSDGKLRVLTNPYEAIGDRFMTAGFAAMQPVVDTNRDLMTRFARAMHESSAYTNSHLPETINMVSRYSGTPTDVIAKSVRMVDADYLLPSYLQPLIDLSARYGLIDKSFPASEIISSIAIRPPA